MVVSNPRQSRLRYASLVVLFLQSTTMVLFMRSTRTSAGPMYKSTTAVVLSEFVKLSLCLLICGFQKKSLKGLHQLLKEQIYDRPWDTLKLAIPSGLYAIQNNLLFIALSHLEAATFQVMYQLKILTTALLSVIILRKKLFRTQWIALFVLMIGVTLVQLQLKAQEDPTDLKQPEPDTPEKTLTGGIVGVLAVLASCSTSGFAGVYFEKILKGTKPSIWLRNIQLAGFGMIFGIIIMWLQDGDAVARDGFFYGYNVLVHVVVWNTALGGLVVAVVIKYADNILKGFALSISIVLSSLISTYTQDFRPTLLWIVGAVLVISATFLYGHKPPPRNRNAGNMV